MEDPEAFERAWREIQEDVARIRRDIEALEELGAVPVEDAKRLNEHLESLTTHTRELVDHVAA
jgi:hypothetical protein